MILPRIVSPSVLTLIVSVTFWNCKPDQGTNAYQNYQDTTVKVYGPYTAVKLPISKGVELGNPIQVALGPDELMYAMNQTGK